MASAINHLRLHFSRSVHGLVLVHLGLGLDVDLPTGEPVRQARVLPVFADGQRELIVGTTTVASR
jgi:hypothetical protein